MSAAPAGMHLTYVSRSRLPSQEANSVHVMKMAQAFARQGMLVDLFARPGAETMSAEQIFARYGVHRLFRVYFAGREGLPKAMFRYVAATTWHALRNRTAVVYTRLPRAAVAAERFGKRSVIELHHPGSYRIVRTYMRVARNPLIVVITETLRRQVISDLGCSPDCVIVAPDGADPMPADVMPVLPPAGPGRLRVGFLGHLYPGKGMEVIAAIAPRCPWADFDIVGGAKADITRWREKIGQLPNVTFHGHVSHAETPGYLRSFDVALLPNQDFVGTAGGGDLNISAWASPLKAFEYMSAGLAIIASDQPNLREVFRDRRNCLLCPPADPAAWISALEGLRDDTGLRRHIGRCAADDFRLRYSWDARARFLDTYLSDPSGGRQHDGSPSADQKSLIIR